MFDYLIINGLMFNVHNANNAAINETLTHFLLNN